MTSPESKLSGQEIFTTKERIWMIPKQDSYNR